MHTRHVHIVPTAAPSNNVGASSIPGKPPDIPPARPHPGVEALGGNVNEAALHVDLNLNLRLFRYDL
jgi:hypothetical protein